MAAQRGARLPMDGGPGLELTRRHRIAQCLRDCRPVVPAAIECHLMWSGPCYSSFRYVGSWCATAALPFLMTFPSFTVSGTASAACTSGTVSM